MSNGMPNEPNVVTKNGRSHAFLWDNWYVDRENEKKCYCKWCDGGKQFQNAVKCQRHTLSCRSVPDDIKLEIGKIAFLYVLSTCTSQRLLTRVDVLMHPTHCDKFDDDCFSLLSSPVRFQSNPSVCSQEVEVWNREEEEAGRTGRIWRRVRRGGGDSG